MKKALVLFALIVLAVPAAHAASPTAKTPRTAAADQQSADSPAQACKAERSTLGVDAFAKKYGTNHNLRNAFGKCVSGKSKGGGDTEKDEDEKADEDESAAAAKCKKERADTGAEPFAKKYGTNHNRANAFGKCVSASTKKSQAD